MSGLSLGKRLTVSFTVVIAFMALLAVLAVMRIAALNSEIDLIVKERYPKTTIANSIKVQTNEVGRGMLGILIMSAIRWRSQCGPGRRLFRAMKFRCGWQSRGLKRGRRLA